MRFQGKTSDQKLDTLEQFIEHWLGPRQSEYGATEGELDALTIPPALRRFYEFCFNWPGKGRGAGRGIGAFSTQNMLARPVKIDQEKVAANHGLLMIAHEDQGVTNWAIPLGEDNPKVYEQDYGDETVSDPDWPYPNWHVGFESIADFLVEFCLHELFYVGIGAALTPLIAKFIEDDSELELLASKVMGHGHKMYLFNNDVLITRTARWKAADAWDISARDQNALAQLEPYSGWVRGVNFSHVTNQDNAKPRNWGVGFSRDGSGYIYSSQSPRYLSRDSIPAGVIDTLQLIESIEPMLVSSNEVGASVKVEIGVERLPQLDGSTAKSPRFISDAEFGRIFQRAINAIESQATSY